MRTIGGLQKLVLLAAALCAGVFVPWGFVRKGEIAVPVYLALEGYVLPLILAGFLVAFVAPSRSRESTAHAGPARAAVAGSRLRKAPTAHRYTRSPKCARNT